MKFKRGDKVFTADGVTGEVVHISKRPEHPYGNKIYLLEFVDELEGGDHLFHGYFSARELRLVPQELMEATID
jgi:hypothetical protein